MDMAIGSMQSGVDGVWSLELVGVTRGAPLLRIDSFGFWIHSFTVLHGGQRRSKSRQVKWTVADAAVTVTVGMEYSNLARVCGGSGSAVVIDWSDWLIGVTRWWGDGWSCALNWIELNWRSFQMFCVVLFALEPRAFSVSCQRLSVCRFLALTFSISRPISNGTFCIFLQKPYTHTHIFNPISMVARYFIQYFVPGYGTVHGHSTYIIHST